MKTPSDYFECPEELARAIDRWIRTDDDAQRLIAKEIWDEMQPTERSQ